MFKIDASDFTRHARNYGELGQGAMGRELMKGLVEENADFMIQQAQKFLDQYVYNAPQGSSTYVRTRRTRNAIKKDKATFISWGASAQAYGDRADYPSYFYAEILNFGGAPGGRMANYRPRPFWT